MIKCKIIKIESKDYYALLDDGRTIRCSLPGKFKNQFDKGKGKQYKLDIVAVGDFVSININNDGTGSIVKIEERKNHLSRKAPRIKGGAARGERLEQVIAANVDNIFIVSSIAEPKINSKVIDRIIVAAESSKINCNIIINKIDLDGGNETKFWFNFYKQIGYNVFTTSVLKNSGIAQIKNYLSGKVNLFWGASGVGKSSILNSLYPHLKFKIGKISDYSAKGQHTTVTSVMELVGKNTFVIDTPGIREIDPFGIQKIDLAHYFSDFVPYIDNCKFNTCIHLHEPECAVVKAVGEGKIFKLRYKSYLNLLDTIEDGMNF